MASGVIVASGAALAALVPVLGIEYAPVFALAAGGLAATQRLPVRFPQLNRIVTAMAAISERRKAPRRDEDKEPLARIKALEETSKRQDKMLGKAVKELKRHVTGCESAAVENKQDNATIIKTQAQHGEVLKEIQEVLPWIRKEYESSKWWKELGHSMAEFFWGMAKKNWDSVSGKLLFFALAGYAAYKGVPWSDVLKMLVAG